MKNFKAADWSEITEHLDHDAEFDEGLESFTCGDCRVSTEGKRFTYAKAAKGSY